MPAILDPLVKKARRWTPGWVLSLRCAFVGGALLWVAGCATDVAPRGSQFVISSDSAAFYKNGPTGSFNFAQNTFANNQTEQQEGPDFRLAKGTHLTMVKREYGYSRVMTDNGVAGYVSNEELQPARTTVVAQVAPASNQPARSYRARERNNKPARKSDDQLDLNDLPLPLPG